MSRSAGKTTFALTYLRAGSAGGVCGHGLFERRLDRRRFEAGLRNFRVLYAGTVDDWVLFDNSGSEPMVLERKECGEQQR